MVYNLTQDQRSRKRTKIQINPLCIAGHYVAISWVYFINTHAQRVIIINRWLITRVNSLFNWMDTNLISVFLYSSFRPYIYTICTFNILKQKENWSDDESYATILNWKLMYYSTLFCSDIYSIKFLSKSIHGEFPSHYNLLITRTLIRSLTVWINARPSLIIRVLSKLPFCSMIG